MSPGSRVACFQPGTPAAEPGGGGRQSDDYTDGIGRNIEPVSRPVTDEQLATFYDEAEQHQADRDSPIGASFPQACKPD